ncbi:MAG: D-alanine--D-alanine ligase [Syntrophorhabdus sp. PtaU1.Bin153]|nr:MAG: D-alanine--D-alanine ligase [Syntrophorhabdus sp. PtaU1.Bin153]
MRVGVVHTAGSPCGCAEAVSGGLKALGHEVEVFDSEEIELHAEALAARCDLVIDHTDTFRGQGMLRALVRMLLETRGARLVGSSAEACSVADDKILAKARLAEAGIPTPAGIVVVSRAFDLPSWLKPPLVLKPAFEHMSRGLALARTPGEAKKKAMSLLNRLHQPILIESYISGRELAVSVIQGPGGLEILPPLEWHPGRPGHRFLTETSKLVDHGGERTDAVQAQLPPHIADDLRDMAGRAFEALGLRDYGRFDVRLSEGGTPFFLEANVTPSLEFREALALSAEWAGLDYPALVERLLAVALARYGPFSVEKEKRITVELPTGPVDLTIPEGVHCPPRSTIQLAELLDIKADETVLELGCGAGLLSIAAARLGARRVVATDLDPRALEAATRNIRANGLESRIEVRSGSWYDAVGSGTGVRRRRERFDVIIATPPQTPGPGVFGPRYGGPDGTRHLFTIIDGAPLFLDKTHGRLWLLATSLANPDTLSRRLEEHFKEVSLVRETERSFTPDDYESMKKGLFDYLRTLRSAGRSDFKDIGSQWCVFRNLFVRASGPKIR